MKSVAAVLFQAWPRGNIPALGGLRLHDVDETHIVVVLSSDTSKLAWQLPLIVPTTIVNILSFELLYDFLFCARFFVAWLRFALQDEVDTKSLVGEVNGFVQKALKRLETATEIVIVICCVIQLREIGNVGF